jgi:hypothetical protein
MTARRTIATLGLLLATALPAVARADPPRTFVEAEAEGASLRYQDGIPIAILSGTPDEIGRQHAALLAAPARDVLKFPKRFAAEFGVEFLWPAMTLAGGALMKNAPQRHQQELAALADRGQLDAGEIAVGNTLLELRRVGCSALIVEPSRSATGGPLMGRNFDFPTLGELDQYSVLLVCRPAGRRAFASVAFPAAIGVVSGMNDAGLAVATLDVYRSADGSPKFNPAGTPLAFVFRRILEECGSVADAEELLRSEKVTTWMNLAVCDRDEGAVFEITPEHINRRDDDSGLVRCTNHFLTEGLSTGESCWRYEALMKVGAAAPPLDVAAVQAALHSANQGDLTLQTMVFEPRTLAMHLAIGKPPTSDDPLVRIDLAPLFASPSRLASPASH